MNERRALLAGLAAGVALTVAGCGSTAHRSTTSSQTSSVQSTQTTQANHYASQTTQSGHSVGPGAIVLRQLGTIHYGCEGATGITGVLDPRAATATEAAYVEGEGRQHLRGGTIQPGASVFAVRAPASRTELWHVIQEHEGETLDARITITLGSGCAGRWLAQVGVITHGGHWTVPRPWL